ncbi:MAG: chemotaxis protein CheW [Deltaproteobacteria bacterium]
MPKIMLFQLGEENYGIDIAKVSEIVEFTPLTPVPRAPNWVEGILNHHGRIATVLNLSIFFDLPKGKEKTVKKIAVIDDPAMDMGILLDDPIEVISLWETKAGISGDSDFVKNKYIGKVIISNGRLINVLDIDKMISDLDGYFV